MRTSTIVALAGLVAAATAGCQHNKPAPSERVYRSQPVCDGATRRDEFEIFRAGFSSELNMSEVEALQELEGQYIEYTMMRLTYPEHSTEGEVRLYTASVVDKKVAMFKLVETYQLYNEAENIDVALMSHYRIGEANELFAVDIENTRVPEGSKEAEKQAFCAALFEKTAGLRAAAAKSYQACADRAQAAKTVNNWSRRCQLKLERSR